MFKRLTRHYSIHFSLALCVTCLLTACGFQLRGTGSNSMVLPESWKSMHLVTASPNSEFSRDVIALLAANGVQWTERDKANLSLVLGGEQFQQRYLSLNAEARVAEYELTMSSQFSILDAENKEIMAPTTVSVVKQVENNPRNVVGKEGEVQMVQREMRSDLAQQIMRRISFQAAAAGAAADSTPPGSPPDSQHDSKPDSKSNIQ
jgi:LPS-assembly lipoprotein